MRARETTWGICCLFNFAGFHKPRENYNYFRLHSKKQGLNLITVELSVGNNYQLSEKDTDILVRVNSGDVLWQKERLLNIGISHLPEICENVVMLDADVVFTDPDWISSLDKALKQHTIIQPFRSVYGMDLSQGGHSLIGEGVVSCSGALAKHGLAWAFRKDFIQEVRLYENAILGSADGIMYKCFAQIPSLKGLFSQAMEEDIENYRSALKAPKISYLNSDLFHLTHGEISNRQYLSRQSIIRDFDYSPKEHLIKTDGEGLLFSKSFSTTAKQKINDYFKSRKEDD